MLSMLACNPTQDSQSSHECPKKKWSRNARRRKTEKWANASRGWVFRVFIGSKFSISEFFFFSFQATHIVCCLHIPIECPTHASSRVFSLLFLFTTSTHFAFSFILYVEHARSKVQVKRAAVVEFFLVRFFTTSTTRHSDDCIKFSFNKRDNLWSLRTRKIITRHLTF